ncbi:arad-like aldolase/epimerase [Thozetella sp. PMI_491]|nr:arad-like aldolase/epimerase [Thozetella sp. PMI_491]
MAPQATDNIDTNTAQKNRRQLLAGIPSFPSFQEHRAQILDYMAAAFRIFARYSFPEGMAGHISASDMVLVDYEGQAIGGNMSRPSNAAGFLIHSALHKAKPDVNAARHAHSIYGKAWSAFGKLLEMINQDACVFYDEAQAIYEDFGGVVFDEAESQKLARALGPREKALTLTTHGLLTVGQTVDEAAYLFMLMEKSCQIQLLADAAAASGMPKRYIDDAAAKDTFEMTSTPDSLYCEFQPELEVAEARSKGTFSY